MITAPILYRTVIIQRLELFAIGLDIASVFLTERVSLTKSQCLLHLQHLYIEAHPLLITAGWVSFDTEHGETHRLLSRWRTAVALLAEEGARNRRDGVQRIRQICINRYLGHRSSPGFWLEDCDIEADLMDMVHAFGSSSVCTYGRGAGQLLRPACSTPCTSPSIDSKAWTAHYGVVAPSIFLYSVLRVPDISLVPATHLATFDAEAETGTLNKQKSTWRLALFALAELRSAIANYALLRRQDPVTVDGEECKHVWTIYPPLPMKAGLHSASATDRQGWADRKADERVVLPEPFASEWRNVSKACIHVAQAVASNLGIDLEIRMAGYTVNGNSEEEGKLDTKGIPMPRACLC